MANQDTATQLALLTRQLEALATHVAKTTKNEGIKREEESKGTDDPVKAKEPKVDRKPMPKNVVEMLDGVPKYSGSIEQSLEFWKNNVKGFCTTFNVTIAQVEPHLDRLVSGQALHKYKGLRKQLRDTKNVRYPNWEETIGCLEELDQPVRRSLVLHRRIDRLGAPYTRQSKSLEDILDTFVWLESQLDPGPLGDRLHLLFRVAPFAEQIVLDNLDRISNIQDATDTVKQAAPKVQYCKKCLKSQCKCP
uniref:ARAD1D11242p n=1 Tax=Blastobotrys adeninivorans TaxID=409370 RepID=A0A060TEW6_BLAAD